MSKQYFQPGTIIPQKVTLKELKDTLCTGMGPQTDTPQILEEIEALVNRLKRIREAHYFLSVNYNHLFPHITGRLGQLEEDMVNELHGINDALHQAASHGS